MKLREEDLKTLYQQSTGAKPAGETACPSEDDILKSFTPETSEQDKFRIVDHVAGCDGCRWKFEAAREILKGSNVLAEEFEGQALSASETAALHQLAKEKIRSLEGGPEKAEKKSFVDSLRNFVFQYRYASIVAGLLMVALAAWMVLKFPRPGRDDVLRGREDTAIELETPRGIQAGLPLLFRWRSRWPGGESEVRVMNEELDVVWTSGRIRATSVELPPALSETIKADSVYYWKVIIYLDDGRINESGLQEFKLKN